MPINFYFILLGQVAVLLVVMRLRNGTFLSGKELLISAVVGCLVGLMYDVTLGTGAVFAYVGSEYSFWLTTLSIGQILVNGIFSYGLSMATVRYLPQLSTGLPLQHRIQVLCVTITAVIVSGIAAYLVESGSIAAMVTYGAVIVAAGESLALLVGSIGPVWSVLAARATQPALTAWAWIIGIGFCYELTNFFFPFWQWLPGSAYDLLHIETLVVLFGYVALFHPMMVVWQIVGRWR